MEDVEETTPEAVEAPWPCIQCTFLNAGALRVCEMCNLPWGTVALATSVALSAEALRDNFHAVSLPSPEGDIDDVWPALADAVDTSWVRCEVSSVGSSWLDMGDALENDRSLGGNSEEDETTSSGMMRSSPF